MHICRYVFTFCVLLVLKSGFSQENNAIIPTPKKIDFSKEKLCIADNFSLYVNDPALSKLYHVFQEDFFTMTRKHISESKNKENSTFFMIIDNSLKDDEYKIEIEKNIKIIGGSYDAVAMGSVTLLQSMAIGSNSICWSMGSIHDFPDFNFRGVLLDVARQKHDIATIKNIIILCRWYKVNYLQLHLTDGDAFTFPSEAFPKLATQGWAYSKEELKDLVSFAHNRGIQIIPELEVPGHAGQLIKKMPEIFGFKDQKLNRNTVNMGRERIYTVLDTLFGEISKIFHTSEFIHIGGDEADFRGMEKDPDIQEFLQKHGLKDIEELYWYFINKMNESVKKAGKKSIVWEGFRKEGNSTIDKDIVVMAWETKYQLPQDILAAGYKTINVSWKPLYIVNNRKWSPEEIFNWNIYKWENFNPSTPSFKTIQFEKHPGITGAMMASWEQPAYVELSSMRKRIPAMVEETWNHSQKSSYQKFKKNLERADKKLDSILTPVKMKVGGLIYPKIEDGRNNEQTWFDDKVTITFSNIRDFSVRYSLDSSPVSKSSMKYSGPLVIDKNTKFKYRAFLEDKPIGMEMLKYFELHPLNIDLIGKFHVPLDSLWATMDPSNIKYYDKVRISISSKMNGKIRYVIGKEELNAASKIYTSPFVIKDDVLVKAGFFINGKIVGIPWIQNFKKNIHK